MPLKKLNAINFRLIEETESFKIFHPAHIEYGVKQAIVFCHAIIEQGDADARLTLDSSSPSFSFLAPAGYELFAVKGHFSDYKLSENFDECRRSETYANYALTAPSSDIFHDSEASQPSLLSVHDDFDIIVIHQPLQLSELIETFESIKLYSHLLFHCSRCKRNELNIKYFLPVEQHAHILAQNKPLDWSAF